ncbi:MAG TPA: dihydroxy-acid dehydratase [Gaiellaceae bacterium]|nr:dihydroxy-acid dehydratase [Gaiellaceae bacterium]
MTDLRSSLWFDGFDLHSYCHRGWLRQDGFSDEALRGRPVVGICNMWSELVGCNVHLRSLAAAVKRGVLQAGGMPFEFSVMTPGEALQKPSSMMYRNLAAMEIEETITSNPLDAVVVLAGCDKTTASALLGAASANVPAIIATGGPALPGYWRGQRIGSGSGYWKVSQAARIGDLTSEEYLDAETSIQRSHGHCMDMGTASTMACISEALGMALPGSAAIPAVDVRRAVSAERSGRRAVELAREDLRPSQILTPSAFRNAIHVLEAIGGSTNAIIHLTAIAGRVGIRLTLDDFAAASGTPVLVDVEPTGEFLMEDFFQAGGAQAVIHELLPLLDGDALTVTGATLADGAESAHSTNADVIRTLDSPVYDESAHAILRGSLAPDGAVLKRSAASPELLEHSGPAIVFSDIYDLSARIDDPELPVTADSVLVLQRGGPKGAPGFPEFGTLPVPQKLIRQGVNDMVRISDSRISGTTFGTIVCHVAPEAAVGGPIGLIETGDIVTLDVPNGRLDVDIEPAELARRAAGAPAFEPQYRRGYGALFLEHVLQAPEGADFDFLQNLEGEPTERLPLLLMHGWTSL